jgi:hypothetical protein
VTWHMQVAWAQQQLVRCQDSLHAKLGTLAQLSAEVAGKLVSWECGSASGGGGSVSVGGDGGSGLSGVRETVLRRSNNGLPRDEVGQLLSTLQNHPKSLGMNSGLQSAAALYNTRCMVRRTKYVLCFLVHVGVFRIFFVFAMRSSCMLDSLARRSRTARCYGCAGRWQGCGQGCWRRVLQTTVAARLQCDGSPCRRLRCCCPVYQVQRLGVCRRLSSTWRV